MPGDFLPQRGNYRDLIAFQKSECVYDVTFHFAKRFLSIGDRTVDQMVQAARSGKQNIAEGCAASTTSRETEIKLLNVARASLQELLLDYEDYLRVRGLVQWPLSDPRSSRARNVCRDHNDSAFYRERLPMRSDEAIANIAITLIHQTDILLRKLIDNAKDEFLREGGIREQMTRARINYRNNNPQ
jgi:four helix bundle suffix protein